MSRPIAGIARRRIAAIAAVLLLALGGLAALPAVRANAASQVVSWWDEGGAAGEVTFFCDNPQLSTFPSGDYALEVYNPCGVRVWLHYYANGNIYAYCVNPGGGLAYDFPYRFVDIQVTSNTSPCWASNAFFQIAWLRSCSLCVPAWNQYPCQMGKSIYNTGLWVYAVWNNETSTNEGPGTCNFRIWVHQYDSGTGQSACIDPGGVIPASLGYTSPVYWQVQETYNQAPCKAGGPPYSY